MGLVKKELSRQKGCKGEKEGREERRGDEGGEKDRSEEEIVLIIQAENSL